MKISKAKRLLILGVILVVIDQVIKILVKTNMQIGEHFSVIGNWFQIFFIENEGMAFGMKFGGAVGKFLLSFFRIALFGVLCWWIASLAASLLTRPASRRSCLMASRRSLPGCWWVLR